MPLLFQRSPNFLIDNLLRVHAAAWMNTSCCEVAATKSTIESRRMKDPAHPESFWMRSRVFPFFLSVRASRAKRGFLFLQLINAFVARVCLVGLANPLFILLSRRTSRAKKPSIVCVSCSS